MQDLSNTGLEAAEDPSAGNALSGLQNLTQGPAASLVRVPVSIQIMLGSAKMPLSDLLALRQGSLFPLEQKLGEPVTVIVNGCKIASGELFVLEGDKLGVKIKDILGGVAG